MLSCWVVTDGKAGMESQCVGLAEALGLAPEVKRVVLRRFARGLTPYLRFAGREFAPDGDALLPPWPDLLIATGRNSVAAALYVKQASGGRTKLVQIQKPAIGLKSFDLVIAPRHDRLAGDNVLATTGALHRVNRDLLAREAERWARVFAHLPRPYIAVLLGGANSAYRFGAEEAQSLAQKLCRAATRIQGSLLVTPSRRTAPDVTAVLSREIQSVPHYLWNRDSENPYFGLLGLADFIVVTCDSVNMVSEAASTGKPVYVEMLPGGSAKSAQFLDRLREAGIVREFGTELATYAYAPLNDMDQAVQRVRQIMPQA